MIRWLQKLRLPGNGRLSAGEARPEATLIDFLVGQISTPQRAGAVLDSVKSFKRLPREQQSKELPGIYLLLEQYLTDVDPLRKLTRAQLRERVRAHSPSLLTVDPFGLIFEPSSRQEVLLCRMFLTEVLRRAGTVLGSTGDNLLASIHDWLVTVPASVKGPIPLGLLEETPEGDEEWSSALTSLSHELYQHLSKSLGEAIDRIYGASYEQIARQYAGLETFPVIIGLLPDELLDEHKIQSLARHRTLERVQGALSAAQMAALETAAQLQAVLNTAGEGIITINADGFIVLVNRETERTFGYVQSELIGTPLMQLLASGDSGSGLEGGQSFGKAQIRQALGRRIETAGVRKDGSVFPLEISVNETQIAERLFYTAAVRDITTRKEFERELIAAKEHAEEMTRLKTIFLGNISHELRTPLTGIMGFAQVLGEEVSVEQREFTQLIHNCARQLLDTLNAVLEFAKLESGRIELRPQMIEVKSRIGQTMELFRLRGEEKGLTLHLRSSDESIFARVDPAALDRVVSNLIENAIKFTQRGDVTVEIEAHRDSVRICVRDTGIGISPEFLSCLFDEFRQESVGLSRSHGGAGLGLAITKRLVQAMQGNITVESEKGKGSAFTITIPDAVEALQPASGVGKRGSSLERVVQQLDVL